MKAPGDAELPVNAIIPAVRRALHDGRNLVVQAPPGAGKSTRIPLALLDADWLGDKKMLMLEPRRVAARAVASYMAELLGERVGETVGYRMRLERRVSRRTRIEVVTEGILTRQLQHDPTLEGVGLVIFDEIHERSLDADLALALTLHTQQLVRDDLRVVAMSATLDGSAVGAILGDGAEPAPVVASAGRAFPVEVLYSPFKGSANVSTGLTGDAFASAVAAAVRDAVASHNGDLLVFLPGAAEIRRVGAVLSGNLPGNVDVVPLYGMLDQDAQRRAIAPARAGRRKIVLATSIAETSLTIEGVRVVVDAGLVRRPRFSPRTGMSRLDTVRVSRAAADQRCGRAGRVAPGICYRLWAEHEQHQLLPHAPPEILNADLAPLALDLALAGVADAGSLRWMDAPPAGALAQARELLRELEMLDDAGRATSHGRAAASLPVHPRSANMLIRAGDDLARAAALAAILGDRDPFRVEGSDADADLSWRVEALAHGARSEAGGARGLARGDGDALRAARAEQQRLVGLIERARPGTAAAAGSVGALLALAYPDRVAQRRASTGSVSRFVMRNGRGASLETTQPLAREDYLVVADVDDRGAEGRIRLAAPITEMELRELFAGQIASGVEVEWSESAGRAEAFERDRLGALILRERVAPLADDSAVRAAALATVRRRGLAALHWDERAQGVRQRLKFVSLLAGEAGWPDVSDDGLLETLADWLAPHLEVLNGRASLADVDVKSALLGMLSRDQRRRLDELAPQRVTVPSGSALVVDYANPAAPALAVRIQELFGLAETPRVGGGRVPLTLHLLSPSRRPVQVTRDLAGFWRNSYFDVRKDLRGRYPKHDWPDDPLRATPKIKRVRPP